MRLTNGQYLRTTARAAIGLQTHFRFGKRATSRRELKIRASFGLLYNLFTDISGAKRSRQTYQIFQTLNDYVLHADPVLDAENYAPRIRKQVKMKDLKEIKEIRPHLTEFIRVVRASPYQPTQKKALIRCFSAFRREAIQGINLTFQSPFASKEGVLRGIEKTGGFVSKNSC
jgi:hypothetical protein